MIRVEDLTRTYGDVRALDRIGFEIGRGEVVGFLGPNGAGKSTTMKIITGFLAPDSGRVEVDGRPVEAGRGSELEARRKIGYLPESTPLYRGMRVDRYLAFVAGVRGVRGADRRRAYERVVEQCDLGGYTRRRIGQLSKGYRQRVGLAQALFSDPDVLILDEPTSGLDPAEIVRIRELIARLAERKTVLLSTHILPEVQETCRRVIILAGGRIVADGSPLDLAGEERAALVVTLSADENEAERVLAAVDGVEGVERVGRDGAGRTGFRLRVVDGQDPAEEVARVVVGRGWAVHELRHETPSLETVFLRRTSGARTGEGAAS